MPLPTASCGGIQAERPFALLQTSWAAVRAAAGEKATLPNLIQGACPGSSYWLENNGISYQWPEDCKQEVPTSHP